MNEVIESLHSRKSVRVYSDRTVEPELKRCILEAAVQAPTAGCQQLYTILDITDQHIKDILAETCDHQPFIAKAPVVLIFCADCQKWQDIYREAGCAPRAPGVGDLMLAVEDAVIAAQNAVTAAHSLGLGSCYIGDIMERCEEHRALLKLPQYVFPAAMLVIGWPNVYHQGKPKRVDLHYIVRENSYQAMDGGTLRAMLAGRTESQGFHEWVDAFCRRKYNSDFSREMTRSVEAYLKAFQEG